MASVNPLDDWQWDHLEAIIHITYTATKLRYGSRDHLWRALEHLYGRALNAVVERIRDPQSLLTDMIDAEAGLIHTQNMNDGVEEQNEWILPNGMDLQDIDLERLKAFLQVESGEDEHEDEDEETGIEAAAPDVEMDSGYLSCLLQSRALPVSLAPSKAVPKSKRDGKTASAAPTPSGVEQSTTGVRALKKGHSRLAKDRPDYENEHHNKLYDAPSLDIDFPSGNVTGVEILTYLPQWVKSWDVTERLVENGWTQSAMAKVINKHRTMGHGKILTNAVYRMMQSAAKHRFKVTGDTKWEDWRGHSHHIFTPGWDTTNLSLRGFRTPRETYRLNVSKQSGIPFKSLADGVKEMPQGDDALDLTRMIQHHVDHPDETWNFPDDWDSLLSHLGGPEEVREEHLDPAAFDRYDKGRSRAAVMRRREQLLSNLQEQTLQPQQPPQTTTLKGKAKRLAGTYAEKNFWKKDLTEDFDEEDDEDQDEDEDIDAYYDKSFDAYAAYHYPQSGRGRGCYRTAEGTSAEPDRRADATTPSKSHGNVCIPDSTIALWVATDSPAEHWPASTSPVTIHPRTSKAGPRIQPAERHGVLRTRCHFGAIGSPATTDLTP
jgi:hypothetical protein